MALAMPVVWSDRHRLHDPGGEVWVGVRIPGTEVPARADAIRAALTAAGARGRRRRAARRRGAARRPRPGAGRATCAGAWDEWEAAGLPDDPGQDRVVPVRLRPRRAHGDRRPAIPVAHLGAAGLLRLRHDDARSGPGTWEAARGAADAALTAVDLVAGRRAGRLRVLPPARPPRHARAPSAAPATSTTPPSRPRALRAALDGPVAVLDVDAHHGNGTQAIFYDRADVLDGLGPRRPRRRLVPALPRLRGRDGRAAARTATCRSRPGTGDEAWLEAVAALARWARGAGRGAGRRARRRRRGRRPGEPARGDRRRVPRRRPRARRAAACRPWSSRRAATTWTTIGALVRETLPGWRRATRA